MCDIQEILCSEARERNIHTEKKNEEETRHKPNDMSRWPCTKYDIKNFYYRNYMLKKHPNGFVRTLKHCNALTHA